MCGEPMNLHDQISLRDSRSFRLQRMSRSVLCSSEHLVHRFTSRDMERQDVIRHTRGKAPPPLPPLPAQLGSEVTAGAEAKPCSSPEEEEDLISVATAALAGQTRVIFLDVDGVLNSRTSREAANSDVPPTEIMEHLKFLIDNTQSKIILSSTWRLVDHKRTQLENLFLQYGLSVNGSTPDLEKSAKGDRVDEILLWLEMRAAKSEHVHAWIAIDDMDLLRMNPRLRSQNFVHTSDITGLDADKTEEALNKLLAQG